MELCRPANQIVDSKITSVRFNSLIFLVPISQKTVYKKYDKYVKLDFVPMIQFKIHEKRPVENPPVPIF